MFKKNPQGSPLVKSYVYDFCGFSPKTTWQAFGGVNYSFFVTIAISKRYSSERNRANYFEIYFKICFII